MNNKAITGNFLKNPKLDTAQVTEEETFQDCLPPSHGILFQETGRPVHPKV